MRDSSTNLFIRFRSSLIPWMLYLWNLTHASLSILAECNTLLMIIGRIALSSKFPCEPAKATALSSLITWMLTITMASSCVGLTFPGMIELPGSLLGRMSSCSPNRGPEPSQRKSLAIFINVTANARNVALAATIAYLFCSHTISVNLYDYHTNLIHDLRVSNRKYI